MGEKSSLQIGVFTTEPLRGAAREFFELFKTPWAFATRKDDEFAVALASANVGPTPVTRLFICAGPGPHSVDDQLGIRRRTLGSGQVVRLQEASFPIQTELARLDAENCEVLLRTADGQSVAIAATLGGTTIVRVGYDLFSEVDRLIAIGQSPADASTPSLELHIDVLRTILLSHNIPVVEILPRPSDHPFIVCLTHDIDFISIRHHRFDHTFLGFVYRVCRSLFERPRRWDLVRKNLGALLKVPAVHLGLAEDFWYPMGRYATVEKGHPATFFFIPFRGRRGRHADGPRGRYRAAPYDVKRYSRELQQLEAGGREVAVHGIDAWCDVAQGQDERRVIQEITGLKPLGIRMHWLYFSHDSPRTLETAGYAYDSTLGFNEAVGFRNGTTQVFRPRGASTLLELPLNIQDTALFFPDRMHLNEADAMRRCVGVMTECARFGGVLTLNWHDRSLAPERNWDRFYEDLIAELENRSAWFAQARDAVAWFDRRRSYTFVEAHMEDGSAVVRAIAPSGPTDPNLPSHCVRVLLPGDQMRQKLHSTAVLEPRRAIEVPLTNHDQSITVKLD